MKVKSLVSPILPLKGLPSTTFDNKLLQKLKTIKQMIGMKPFRAGKSGAGFTLIELLIVIAVIGILAAGLLVLINPLEQMAKARDVSRKSTITQLGKALLAYYFANNSYPVENNSWMTTLVTAKELQSAPINPSGSTAVGTCFNGTEGTNQNGYCYQVVGTYVYIEAPTESKAEGVKGCPTGRAWYRWRSDTGNFVSGVCHSWPPL